MNDAPQWLVVFQPANSVWWHKWLRPGFGHCFAISVQSREGGGTDWVLFDPGFSSLDVRIVPRGWVVEVLALAKRGGVTILEVPRATIRLVRPRWLVTCAGAVAALLGLRETPLTPWGLYCRLLAAGAAEVR